MKQLTQKLKDGIMQVLEVPSPVLKPGMVLVRNRFSLINFVRNKQITPNIILIYSMTLLQHIAVWS